MLGTLRFSYESRFESRVRILTSGIITISIKQITLLLLLKTRASCRLKDGAVLNYSSPFRTVYDECSFPKLARSLCLGH